MIHTLAGILQQQTAGFTDPTDITGCALWLRRSFTYSADPTISVWEDESGNNRDFSGAATRVDSQLNGKSIVRFNGTSDSFSATSFASGFTSAEIFIVIKIDADPPAANKWGIWRFGTDGSEDAYPFTNGVIYEGWGSSARKTTGAYTPSQASWRLYNIRSASGAWSSHLDGTQHHSTATNTVAWTATFLLGLSHNTKYLDGEIAEVIMYDNVISTGDRGDLHGYIETEYGLTIA